MIQHYFRSRDVALGTRRITGVLRSQRLCGQHGLARHGLAVPDRGELLETINSLWFKYSSLCNCSLCNCDPRFSGLGSERWVGHVRAIIGKGEFCSRLPAADVPARFVSFADGPGIRRPGLSPDAVSCPLRFRHHDDPQTAPLDAPNLSAAEQHLESRYFIGPNVASGVHQSGTSMASSVRGPFPSATVRAVS